MEDGTGGGWRRLGFPGKGAIVNTMLAPLLVPGIVIGTALSVFFVQMSVIWQWDALSSLTGLPGLDPDDPRAEFSARDSGVSARARRMRPRHRLIRAAVQSPLTVAQPCDCSDAHIASITRMLRRASRRS